MSLLSNVSDPVFGLAEAARVCGVSKPTVRRRKGALVRAGAVADDTGWQIPAEALVAVGLLDRVPATRALSPVTSLPVRSLEPVVESTVEAAQDDRVAELESELARVREQLAAAAARAEERDRCLRVLETALAALSDGRPGEGVTPTPVPTPTPPERRTPASGPWRSPATWTHPTGG